MVNEPLQLSAELPPVTFFSRPQRSAASYEVELAARRETEIQLREILARGEDLLQQKDQAIEYQVLMQQAEQPICVWA